IAAPVAGLIVAGVVSYRLLAPEPPAATPTTTVAADAVLSDIAARPSIRRDQSSPFAVGWHMLDPDAEFNLPVPATTRLTESYEGPYEGAGRVRQLRFGGINADAVVTVFWNEFNGVD